MIVFIAGFGRQRVISKSGKISVLLECFESSNTMYGFLCRSPVVGDSIGFCFENRL